MTRQSILLRIECNDCHKSQQFTAGSPEVALTMARTWGWQLSSGDKDYCLDCQQARYTQAGAK